MTLIGRARGPGADRAGERRAADGTERPSRGDKRVTRAVAVDPGRDRANAKPPGTLTAVPDEPNAETTTSSANTGDELVSGRDEAASLPPPDTEASEAAGEDGPDGPDAAAPRRFRRRKLWWSAAGTAALVAVLVGGALGYVAYRNSQIHHVTVRNLVTPAAGSSPPENILLIGSTSRCALKTQNPAFGLCSAGVTGVNSDVVMIVHLDPATHRASLLSLPRDTFIPNARPGEANRIDAALAYGPSQLVAAIEQDFGIAIAHYVELNFDSFAGVVNALGGLNMYFPDRVYDAYSGLKVTHAGCIHLNGFQALSVVRARHLYYWLPGQPMNIATLAGAHYDGSGDLGRIQRDHEFLRVLATTVAKRGLGNPLTDNSLLGAIAPQLTVDQGFSLSDLVHLALSFHGVDANAIPQATLPVLVNPSFAYMYKGYDYGSIVFPSAPQDQQVVDAFLGRPVVGSTLAARTITVSVLGGIGSPGATATTARALGALGYRVLGTSEQTPVGPLSETTVTYSPGHRAAGERVLASLRGAVALGEGTTLDGAQVTVVTGTDFTVDTPPVHAHTTAAPRGTPGTARLTAAVSANPLWPVTPASVPLPTYDPRACPAGR